MPALTDYQGGYQASVRIQVVVGKSVGGIHVVWPVVEFRCLTKLAMMQKWRPFLLDEESSP